MSRNIANEIWHACDILRRDNNCTGIMEYIQHLSWLLFLRFLDAQEEEWEVRAKYAGKSYKPIIEKPYRWRDWARKEWNAEELLSFIHGNLIPYLKSLSGNSIRNTIRNVFSDLNVIVCASGYNLMDVLEIIDSIDFHDHEETFAVSQVYEELLRRLGQENRVAGEFYTPRPVIKFVVEVINPQIGEKVYDPACGTCGFLVEAFLWMEKKAKDTQDRDKLQEDTFYGQEKKPIPALLGLMNMVLHGIYSPKVVRKNTLEEDIRNPPERFDVILTNPPFGGKEGKHIQQNFPIKSQATELLFLQHVMKKLKLKEGARCGMVVPEGTLFRGGAFKSVKKKLLEDFNLHTIVSLPPGTFAPYSDVKTALIFFERPGPTREIWYYELKPPNWIDKEGKEREGTRFTKQYPIKNEHFEEVRRLYKVWNDYRKGIAKREDCISERSWIVSVDEIKQRDYDLSPRNPHSKNSEHMPEPADILASLIERKREIESLLEELRDILDNGHRESRSE
ncbi:MAG: N-6 DNA methylase [candidate division WOR-3 bacterium]|nr:type I restriction-modification system subunit M [candidate division WOR-3 bacterium]MDW8151136.1 N-6 DNA methylase [candidate division WOR-3 bacterium]